jgi:hypothetical protein
MPAFRTLAEVCVAFAIISAADGLRRLARPALASHWFTQNSETPRYAELELIAMAVADC